MRTGKILTGWALGLVLGGVFAAHTQAQAPIVGQGFAPYNTYGGYDLFYNYYTQGYANQTNAAMYLAPVPVPPNVGHTFYTYQPLYPHEMMHWHYHRYHNYYDNGRGLNRTKVDYYGPPVRTGINYVHRHLQLPRP
jgi:hypothetical protein